MVAGAGATSIAISGSERAELLRDPEKFAARAEAVLNSVVAKLNRLKAEQAAERIDSEQQYHKLERSQATLRAEHERAVAQHDKMAAEHASIVQARDTATGEVARLNRELREKSAEIVRAQEQVHESGDERRRMVEVNERMSRQLEAAESDVTAAREALAQARSSSAAHERRAVEKEAEAMAAKMQASTQLGQLELANQRTEQAEQFVKQLTAELTAVRERKAEAQVTSSAMHAEVAAERAMLASQLKQAQQLAAGLQSQLDTLTAQHTAERSESAAHTYTLQRNLEESERLKETYRVNFEQVRGRSAWWAGRGAVGRGASVCPSPPFPRLCGGVSARATCRPTAATFLPPPLSLSLSLSLSLLSLSLSLLPPRHHQPLSWYHLGNRTYLKCTQGHMFATWRELPCVSGSDYGPESRIRR
jgi:chromosome segregation ATPase